MFGFIKKVFFTGLAFISSLVSTATLNRENEDKCSSCILCIMLFSIFCTASIYTYFVYCKYANSN